MPQHEKPLAGDGLTSYRYRGPYGYVMISARDHQDALNEARRSLTEGDATIDNLQVWDGNQYVDVTGPVSGDARPEAGVAKAGEKAPQVADPRNDIADKPAAKPKSKAQARKEKDEAQRQRTRDMLGAKEGDIVTPSADIGYSRAGESYRVISIGADGSVYVENVVTGGRTQWSRSDLAAATRRGVEFARQEAATGAESAPASEQAGQKATPSKRQTAKQGAEPEQPKQEKASEPHPLVGKTVRFVAWGKERTGVVTGVSDGAVAVRGQGGLYSVEIDRVEVIEEAEARSDKAELTPDDLDRIPFPLEAGYRIVSRPAKGAVVIAPRKIGTLYTDDDFKALVAYAKPFGFTIMRHGEKRGYAYIIAPLDRPYDWLGAFFSDGGVAEAARKQRAQEEAEEKRRKEAQKEEEYRNLPSSKWIDENLGTEFTNLHNRLMLARVLDGVDKKFRGLIDRFWLSPLESIGFDLEQHGSDNADVIAFLKRKYAEQAKPKQEKAKPEVSKNRIFTEEAAEKARQVLRSKLGQMNSGIDPEIMQAGITLAGYHIEKGARTFAAYAKAMIEDMGEAVRPYLKSWYLGVRFDPRAAEFADDMDSAAAVESFDLDRLDEEPSTTEREGAERSEPELTETVVTPSGRELEVRFKVVEADNLITSNDLTGRVNPDYPAELQPRDRSRATSQAQITEIAANINPRLLGSSPSATDGAPIVGPDNVVESGNGRTLALRLAYERGLESAEKYRRWLAEQGYNVEGMRAPVLVRERVTELTPEERQAFTVEANERTTLEMSATERAMADAQRVGEIIHLYRGGDVDAAANRDFVRAFADRVVSPSDRGRFIDRNGAVSVDGIRRMQAALVAHAYGDEALVTTLFESTDNDIRAIGGALLDVSGIWAQMRQESREGVISPLVDVTPNLLEAVRIVRRARSEGRPIAELVAQNDMFAGAIDPTTLYFLGVLYRGENYTRARSRDKVAGALRYYTEQARLTQPTENMFGEPPVSGDEIARHTYERLQREEGQTDQQSDILARPRADAEDAGEAGGGRRRQGAGAASEADSPAAAEGDVDVPSPSEDLERDRGQRGAGEPVIRASNEDERRADTASPGRAGEGAGGARRAGQRDRGVSEAGAAARGERSNQPVYQQDGEYESPRGAARDTERGGSRRDSDTGSAVEQERAEDIARHAQTPRTGEFAERLAAQREAQNVPTVWGDKESIDAALPLLLSEQREDVLKAEQRFANHNGMLFTNSTGTGKTFTGLGIAKRFYNAGKRNILVVVPSDKVASDWVKSAGYLDLPLKQLASTADNGGSGPVVTTYANFGQNPTLVDREWDLVIADESHYLMSSEDAEVTRALAMLRALTGHPEGFYTWLTNKYRDLYQQYTAARDDLRNAGRNPDIPQEEYARREARANQLNAQWTELENRERPIWQQRWAEQRDLPRVTFLSATPFAYVKNVEYAEGYLFNHAPPAERFNMRSRGYNEGGPREQFFVQNFGYRMRYNKLTEPEAGVNTELLEQEFHERLKREGALSGRRLEVPYDYERRFLLVEDAVGTKIDEGLKWLHDYDDGRFRPLYDYVKEQFTYHQQMFLLEAIKAKHAIPHIKKHLALGRKVVVFHDFNKGGGFHPFNIPTRPGVEISYLVRGKSVLVRWDDLVQAFRNLRPDLANMDMRDLYSPIEAMRRAFPDALFFNGTISKAERRKNADLFNDDNSGRNLIVVQSDAGREGISLHDTTGKHQRVLINLGIPVKPVAATQIEGRIYRTGQASNAIFDYMTTGTAWEAYAFGTKIAERASTAENLALGYEARGLRRAFIDAYQNARFFEPSKNDGTGGKAYDRTMGVSSTSSDFERAKTYYWAQQKNTKRRDQREGVDYFATPEPVGLKMVQWADIRPNESVLEPSAGHGAIARFVPDNARLTMVEPSYDLAQRAALARGDARIVNERFEDLHINNKYNAIVMNPPYGTGGKTAVEHLAKAAKHLRDGGRIVALLPRGGMADQRLNRFLASDEAKNLHTVAEILLPPSTFERAGTKVNTKIVILERQDNPDVAATLEQHHIDLSNVETVEELFDRIEHIEMPARAAVEATPEQEIVEHITKKGKRLRGVIRTDLTKEQAQSIDPYTFRKKNEAGETGWFIRERHLEELNAKFPLRLSISEVGTRTSADLLVELRAGPLGSLIDRLLANNRVVLHDTVREIGPNVPAGVQGFTESDGTIHLVAEHLRPGTASSVLLHEAFHGGTQSLLGDAQWQRLKRRLGALYRQAQRSEGKLNEFWRQAHGRVEHAKRMGDRMSEAIAIEEFGAYAIENYERAPRTLKKWVDDLIGAIKAWLVRRFGIQVGDVTPAQLRALALAALRASAERPAVNIPRRPLGGVALNAGPLSVADIPETIEVDGVERPTRNSEGRLIHPTEEGIRNFWRWFADSKVVDRYGRPLIVYHGTYANIDAFRTPAFFAEEPEVASAYAGGISPNVVPVYLRISNPLRMDDIGDLEKVIGDSVDLTTFDYDWEALESKKVIGAIKGAGYDGVYFTADAMPDTNETHSSWVVFENTQIKSAVGNVGTFDPANPDIRYSIKPSEHFKDLTDEQKRFLDKIGPERLPQRLSDRWRQLTDNLGLRIRQAGVDRYAALLRNDQAIYGEDTLEGSIASSSWVLARMSHSAGGALTAMLNHGRIYLDPKEKVIDVREGTEGLRSVFQSLGTPQEIDRFMAWVAANRAKKLLGEGRENLFTPDEVDAGIKLSAGKLEDGRARPVVYQQAWEKFKQYRDDVLGIAEQAGIITPEQRQTWSEEFYVPFYRVLDDDTVGGPSSSSGLSRQQAYKRLKGGKQNLNDLLENTLLNFHHLIQASLKNQAAQQAVKNAMELGIAEPTTESKRDKKLSTWVMVNGEKRWYNVHDPLTFKALSALAHPGYNHPLMKAGRAFKRLFTSLTTVTPQFVIANTLRDSLSAMATSPTSGVPFENALKGAAVYGNEYNRARMIASGGSFSFGHVYGQNPDDIKASLKGTLREGRLLSDPGLIPGALRNAWRKWQNVTDFAENVNRAGIWERNLEQGKLKAAFEARDLMDFSAHGDALIVRLLIDLVPFLNARIQGLDKLYRSGFKPGAKVIAGTATAADRKSFARFAAVTGALSLLSMLLYLRNWDDEEYRKLEDWQRDTYWFIRFGDNAFFIPKPFEVGAIATLAERGLEQFMDPTVGGKKFGERLWHMLTDTFAFDMPQIVKPVYELAANRNTFTGRPIEDIGMQRLSPSQRFRPNTSRLAEGISRGMEAVVGDAALSPVQIDHLIAGYLGQVGAGTVATADVLWRRAMGEQLPARRWSEYQPIRRFYRDLGVPAPYTRYSTDFYNALKEADRAYANVQHLLKYQEYERAAALEAKESDKLAMRKQLNKVARDLSKINAQMRQIQIDKTMDSEQKRYELDRLRELRNMITESVGKALEEERARKGAAERPSARP